jgi:hypothetical protein
LRPFRFRTARLPVEPQPSLGLFPFSNATSFSVAPTGLDGLDGFYPQLKLRAIFVCPFGTQFPTRLRNKERWTEICGGNSVQI